MKNNLKPTKIKTENSIFVLNTQVIFLHLSTVINKLKISFNISLMRVKNCYHRFNNLTKLLNGDLAVKVGRGVLSVDLMDR